MSAEGTCPACGDFNWRPYEMPTDDGSMENGFTCDSCETIVCDTYHFELFCIIEDRMQEE